MQREKDYSSIQAKDKKTVAVAAATLPQTPGAHISLIINADDFGLTQGINHAIAELHRAGALTSATLMATGPAFADAVATAHAHPTLGVGCHIVLVDGSPAAPLDTIPTLLGADRKTFRNSLTQFSLDILRGEVKEQEIALEARAQIERLQRAGIAVTHIDTHKHTHMLPSVARPLLDAAERAGIRAIRNPFEPLWSLLTGSAPATRRFQLRVLTRLRPQFLALPQIRSGTIRTTDGTIGIAATGALDEPTLRFLLKSMPAGNWELVCHPGYNDPDLDRITTRLRASRDIERSALLSVLGSAPASPLIDFGGLAAERESTY